jgi:hypothetical protein
MRRRRQPERKACRLTVRNVFERNARWYHNILIRPADPCLKQLVAHTASNGDQSVRVPRQFPLDRRDHPRDRWREISVEKVPMEGVYHHGPTRSAACDQSGRSAKRPCLGGVRMQYVRAELTNFSNERGPCAGVV